MSPPLVLPFRGDQFSFTLNFKESSQDQSSVDFSAVVIGRDGKVLDVINKHKPSALDSAIVTSHDRDVWLDGTSEVFGTFADEAIHVRPKRLDPTAEVIVLVASVPYIPGQASDLSMTSKLEFIVSYPDEEEHSHVKNHRTTDLKSLVSQPHPLGPLLGLGNGQQSMIIAVAYSDQPGWTVREDLSTFNYDSYAHLIPEVKRAVLRVKADAHVDLDAARSIEEAGLDEFEMATYTRKCEDHDLIHAAGLRIPVPPPAEPAAEGAEAARPPAVPAPPTKLRLDIGWSTWKKPKVEGEEEEEGDGDPEATELDFALIFYNLAGEEIQQVSSGSTEADGVKVGREYEDPEPEEEPEPEDEEPEEAGAEEEGEDGEPKPPVVKPPPLEPKEDPYAFTLKHTVFLNLAELPKDIRSAVLVVSNYAGAGFQHVRHVRVKVYNISNGEDGIEMKGPTTPPRELIDYGLISKYTADAAITQVVLLKMYKEYTDSAFNLWRTSGKQTVGDYFADGPGVKEAIKKFQVEIKEFKAKEAALLAKAEEDGEELAYEIRTSQWRYSVPGLTLPGESLEAAEHDVKNVINYDGPLVGGEVRTFPCARVMFANGDTYFGGYKDDLKSGPGIYLFNAGAAYVGEYSGGKREGSGYLIMPDGGLYEGQFKADKFDGQGQYRYPDGSVYTGSWKEGLKDGPGAYWDTSKGCLRGSWSKGILKGEGTYDQPAIQLKGEFMRGVPAGPCQYTAVSHRTLDMDKFAAAHILEVGPTLKMSGEYAIPPGSGVDPQLDEEGKEIEDDSKPPLPSFPKYEGMTFVSKALPDTVPDVHFPPLDGLVRGITLTEEGEVPVTGTPVFTVPEGIKA